MTVLVNGTAPTERSRPNRAHRPLLHSALAAFAPKPRAERTRGPGWLRVHGRRVKDTLVALVACGLPTVAAFEWHTWAGLVAAAIGLVVVDAVADPPREVSPDEHAQ